MLAQNVAILNVKLTEETTQKCSKGFLTVSFCVYRQMKDDSLCNVSSLTLNESCPVSSSTSDSPVAKVRVSLADEGALVIMEREIELSLRELPFYREDLLAAPNYEAEKERISAFKNELPFYACKQIPAVQKIAPQKHHQCIHKKIVFYKTPLFGCESACGRPTTKVLRWYGRDEKNVFLRKMIRSRQMLVVGTFKSIPIDVLMGGGNWENPLPRLLAALHSDGGCECDFGAANAAPIAFAVSRWMTILLLVVFFATLAFL